MYFIRKFNPEIHHRKSIRLRGYDYTRPGMYFITIVTCQGCKIMFGVKTNGKIILNEIGEIVQDEWLKTPIIRCNVKLDEFIVMPDHFHGIIALFPKPSVGATGMENNTTVGATGMENNTTVGATGMENNTTVGAPGPVAPTTQFRPRGPQSGSVGAIMAQFKTQTTKRINKLSRECGRIIWQRNYYDRIIRNDKELEVIRGYIRDNPDKYCNT